MSRQSLPPSRSHREGGFAMVALLVGMSVAAIWMMAALPAWRQQAQRQREDDLIFRGEQYARAIVLYQQANRGANPPSVDVLVSGKYLRKKWKDPITNKDFVLIGNGIANSGTSQTPQSSQTPGRATPPTTTQTPGRGGAPSTGNPGGGVPIGQQGQQQSGITGVRSESTATSIKVYQNQQQYSLWPFDAALARLKMTRAVQQPGGAAPGGQPGGPGRQTQPGRGQPAGPGGGPARGAPAGPGRGGGPVSIGPGRAGGS